MNRSLILAAFLAGFPLAPVTAVHAAPESEFVSTNRTISGGTYGTIFVGLDSDYNDVPGVELTLTGGTSTSVNLGIESSLLMNGGATDFLYAQGGFLNGTFYGSTADVIGGTVGMGSGNAADVFSTSTLNIRGGTFNGDVRTFGQTNIFGGMVNGNLLASENGMYTFYGLGFSAVESGLFFGMESGLIYDITLTTNSGIFNYTVYDVNQVGEGEANPGVQFNFVPTVVPEANAGLLFSLAVPAFVGGITLRNRRK